MLKAVLLTLINFCYFFCCSQNCNCKKIADSLFFKLESNYIDKELIANDHNYLNLKIQLAKKRFENINESECLRELSKINSIIHDKHIVIFKDHSKDKNWRPEVLKDIDISNDIKFSSPIEGFWLTQSGDRVLIKKSQDDYFNAIWLDSSSALWQKGSIKGVFYSLKSNIFDFNYFSSNLLQTYRKATLENDYNTIEFGGVYWSRLPNKFDKPEKKKNEQLVTLETDSVNFSILTIRSFVNTKKLIDSILNKYKDYLEKIPHLIIDISQNKGGSVTSYKNIIPYLYTNPIIIEKAKWLSSVENIANLKKSADKLSKSDTASYNSYTKLINKMRLNPGAFVFDASDTIVLEKIKKNPVTISLIIGKATASAAELFTLISKQSKKVTIYGENSEGASDNLDAYFNPLDSTFGIYIPISKRCFEVYKKPIDNIGIKPDIYLKDNKSRINIILNKGKGIKSKQ